MQFQPILQEAVLFAGPALAASGVRIDGGLELEFAEAHPDPFANFSLQQPFNQILY